MNYFDRLLNSGSSAISATVITTNIIKNPSIKSENSIINNTNITTTKSNQKKSSKTNNIKKISIKQDKKKIKKNIKEKEILPPYPSSPSQSPLTDSQNKPKKSKILSKIFKSNSHNHQNSLQILSSIGMLFNKFSHDQRSNSSHSTRNPKKAIKSLEAIKQEINTEPYLWNRAILRAQGERVFDNEKSLKKSIKSLEKRKEKSANLWNRRLKTLGKERKERQITRRENIQQRINFSKAKKQKRHR